MREVTEFDAWGNHLYIMDSEIARINPIRYRGYYWDAELGLFYLQSRYYCPQLRRFISADAFMDTATGILGTNMYIYCNNDPVNFIDPAGYSPWRAAFAPVGLLFLGAGQLLNQAAETRSHDLSANAFSENSIMGLLRFLGLEMTEENMVIASVLVFTLMEAESLGMQISNFSIDATFDNGVMQGTVSFMAGGSQWSYTFVSGRAGAINAYISGNSWTPPIVLRPEDEQLMALMNALGEQNQASIERGIQAGVILPHEAAFANAGPAFSIDHVNLVSGLRHQFSRDVRNRNAIRDATTPIRFQHGPNAFIVSPMSRLRR